MSQQKTPQLTLIISVVVLVVLSLIGYYIFSTTDPEIVETATNTTSEEVTSQSGTIMGSLTYPSERIPSIVQACAVNVDTDAETCTDEHIKDEQFVYGVGFELTVSPGSYTLFARMPDQDNAYFDEYIRTTTLDGNSEADPCQDESLIEPIVVEVQDGETVDGVILGDWYYPFGLVNCS